MKKSLIILTILLASIIWFAPKAHAAISFVQVVSSSIPASSVSTTFSLYLPSVTASDTLIYAVTNASNGAATLTCSDSNSDTFNNVFDIWDPVEWNNLAICYATNVKGGNTTTTVTWNSSVGGNGFIASEYSGINQTNPLDVSQSNITESGTTGTDAVTSNASTTLTGNELIFGDVADSATNVNNYTAGTGFTERAQQINGSTDGLFATEDMIQTATGSVAATFTQSSADSYLAGMAAFNPATSTPTSSAPFYPNYAMNY